MDQILLPNRRPASSITVIAVLVATAMSWTPFAAIAQEAAQEETASTTPPVLGPDFVPEPAADTVVRGDAEVPLTQTQADTGSELFEGADQDTPTEPVDVIDRWRAAPNTIFDASEIVLADLQYVARPLIVMAGSQNDPMVAEQIGLFTERMSELVARDVIIILDTDPAANTAVRAQFRPRGFSMILVTKDGRIALRKPVPWAVREIVQTIDRLPIRQQELP